MTRERLYGIIGATLFCLALLMILMFSILKTIVPQDEVGVLVNFGNVSAAAGTFEPMNTGSEQPNVEVPPAPPVNNAPATPAPDQSPVTQNVEETVSIAEAKKKKEEEKKREEQHRIQEEQKRLADAEVQRKVEETRKKQAIQDQMSGAFGKGNTAGSQGTAATGQGNQGSIHGNAETGADIGIGGSGEFSLAGRSLGTGGLPRPAYTIQEEGRIVVDITVNTNGDVILTSIGKGTNIDNARLRQSALAAAKKAKFNTITGTANQSGTITYKYNLK